jgi:branched-chain amino acid transport system permease protein
MKDARAQFCCSRFGPALGALIFFLLKDAAGDLTEHWPAIIASRLIVVMVMLPRARCMA